MPRTIVLYHGPGCADGFGAAWAASLNLGVGPDVAYIAMQYGQPIPPEVIGSVDVLYMLDFSMKRPEIEKIAAGMADRIVIIDHHRTAETELSGLDIPGVEVHFDTSRSGAPMAWEYFHPGKPIPYLLNAVEDRDLWAWKLPCSRELSAFLASHLKTFQLWNRFAEEFEDDAKRAGFAAEGRAILRYQAGVVAGLAKKPRWTTIAGYHVPYVNSPVLQSEIGERMLSDFPAAPFAAIYFDTDQGDRVFSLRSRPDFDVSAVAKELGGGGHPNAAGFVIPMGGGL